VRILIAVFLFVPLWSSCAISRTASGLEQGHVVPFEEVLSHRGRLRQLIVSKLDARDPYAGFYVLEMYKSLVLLAFEAESGATPAFPEYSAPIEVADGSVTAPPDSRGIVLSKAPSVAVRQSDEPTGARSQSFWRHQALVDQRVGLTRRYGTSTKVLSEMFVVDSVEKLQRRQRVGDLTLSFFLADEAVYVFVVSQDEFTVVKLDATATSLFRLSARLLASLRKPSSPLWRDLAVEVYRGLFADIEPHLQMAKTVTIIPDGFLANVPFSVLIDDGGRLLTDRMSISFLPSASFAGGAAKESLVSDPPRVLVAGNPIFPEGFPPLDKAEDEARAVARVFDDATLLVGQTATEQRFRDAAPRHNILHLATHGYLSPLGEGTSSLLLSRDATADGEWSSSEIAAVDLSGAYLTVLSACDTSVSPSGTRSLSGITAAFLAAGSPTVIGSLWQVSDDSTSLLMVRFYERFLELGYLDALRAAQADVRGDPRYEHPYYWAAFVLYGASK
jgi:CHAT domain-containing protein